MGTPCQTKTESACLTCGFLDSIHLLLAWYRAISACRLNHVLLRSFRHFLITVSETDSNKIPSNLNFPLPFQINCRLPAFVFLSSSSSSSLSPSSLSPTCSLQMFQRNCIFGTYSSVPGALSPSNCWGAPCKSIKNTMFKRWGGGGWPGAMD